MADLSDLANLDYVHRVNRAIDHVTQNLAAPLQLEEVARVACFSPYHFHRVFRALVGETLHGFVKRVRLERAVHLMANRPGATLTEIALAVGFSSSSDFSRSFRAHFGVPPSAFDVDSFRSSGRDRMIDTLVPETPHLLARLPHGTNPDGFVPQIRELPARRVAYVRALDPYRSGGVTKALERLMAWAVAHGLADNQWLGYQWEDPEIVALENCRYDVGLEIASDVRVDEAGINLATFAPMTIAELEIVGAIDLEMRALDFLYKTWLPTSGYVPADLPGFEAWIGRPFAHGSQHFELRVQLPIVSASAPL